MCLTVKFDSDGNLPAPMIADTAIIVFKALNVFHLEDGPHYESPFRCYPYDIYAKQVSALEVEKVPSGEIAFNGNEAKVTYGLHTFGDLAGYASYLMYLGVEHPIRIFVAVIPKGAKYYRGSFEGTENCYTSDELVVLPRSHPDSLRLIPADYPADTFTNRP